MAKHSFGRGIDVSGEWKNLEGEVDYWRERVATVSRQFRIP
jgi:hypothetical protein